MQQRKDSPGTTLKKSYLGFFFKFFAKRILCAQGHIFNKINTRIVQKPDESDIELIIIVKTSGWEKVF